MKHDDVVDALSYQGILIDRMSEGLTQEEVKDEEWEREYEESDNKDQGRSQISGY